MSKRTNGRKNKQAEQAVVIQQSKESEELRNALVVRPSRIESTDVGSWRNAINAAIQGNRGQLYNLYANLLADPVLADALDKLTESVTNAEVSFQLKGESVEEIDDLIDTPEFDKLLKEIALKFAWGKSVIDVSFAPEFEVFSFPRKNICVTGLDKPMSQRHRYIAVREGDRSGYDYTQDEYIIDCGEDEDLGLLFRAALFVIYKRGGWGDWAQFIELFAMPFIVGEYDGYNENAQKQLVKALSEIGSNTTLSVPKGVNIKIEPNKSSGSSRAYDDFTDRCDRQILIAMLGNTMTTLEGSSRAQGEVHMQTQEERFKAIRRYVQRVLNRYLVPLLVKRGYKVAGGAFLFPDAGESISTKDRVAMALKLMAAGIVVDADYLYEITGIPKSDTNDSPKEKEEQEKEAEEKTKEKEPEKEQKEEEKPAEEPPKKEKKKKEEEQKLSDERNFFLKFYDKTLGMLFHHAPTNWSGAYRNWKRNLTRRITGKIELADGYSINIDKLIHEAIQEVYRNKGEELINKKLFDITNDALQEGIDKSLTREDVDEDFVKQFKENTAVFAAFKNHKQTEEIAALIYDSDGKLRSFREFRKLALQISEKYNEQYLQTEYNTAVRAARMAANLKKFEKTKHLYPNLEYMLTGSANPRHSHLDYVGTILPIDHEAWEWLLPPSDWNCDCWVRVTDKEPTAAPMMPSNINLLFVNNPAQTAEFINTKESPYYKHTGAELREEVAKAGKQWQLENEAAKEIYTGKKGGYLEIVPQQIQEADQNLVSYKIMADNGGKYKLMPTIEGQKNPDAYNLAKSILSDAKHPEIGSKAKTAIQNRIKEGGKQKAKEIIIRFEEEVPSKDIYEGIRAAFQENRNRNVEDLYLIRVGRKPLYFNVAKLREHFSKVKK